MISDPSSRPFAFLISTSGGEAAEEVLNVLTPAIEQLGTWRKIPYPESSLTHAAAQAEAAGLRPIHLALGQLQDLYLTPAVSTVSIPLWDYPDIPTTDLHRNGRLNWARVANYIDLILAPSTFTAEAFRKAGVSTPIQVLPLPSADGWGQIATWGPGLPITLDVPHISWFRQDLELSAPCLIEPLSKSDSETTTWSQRCFKATRLRLRRLKPYLSNASLQTLDGYRQRVMPILRKPDPIRMVASLSRAGYRRFVGRWVSDEAHRKLRGLKNRLRGSQSNLGKPPMDQVLQSSTLTLSGLVYSAFVDYSDPAMDDVSLITAAVHAFRDRPDVTLLLRLNSPPEREAHDLQHLAWVCESPRIDHQCRIVVVTGHISLEDQLALGRATSFFVDTSRTRGSLMRTIDALSEGRPVIAPTHSAFADWIDSSVGLPVESNPEPAIWPIDAEARHTTVWNRVVWSDLRDRLIESVEMADHQPLRYESLSATARQRLAERTGNPVIVESLRNALTELPARPSGALAWR